MQALAGLDRTIRAKKSTWTFLLVVHKANSKAQERKFIG
jgi:hypothetical protein